MHDYSTLKARILDFIADLGEVNFAMLALEFEEFRTGDATLLSGENVVLWTRITAEAADAMRELQNANLITFRNCRLTCYEQNGYTLDLPRVESAADQAELHWLPVCMSLRIASVSAVSRAVN